MQTFLPYPDYKKSAQVLDYRRLGKQRVEAYQILCALHNIKFDKETQKWTNHDSRWKNHPAVLMWNGNTTEEIKYSYHLSLCIYTKQIIKEWINRGYVDNILPKILYIETFICNQISDPDNAIALDPPFIGNEEFHASHRSNLLRKKPEYYGQFGWKESDNLEYIWPVVT